MVCTLTASECCCTDFPLCGILYCMDTCFVLIRGVILRLSGLLHIAMRAGSLAGTGSLARPLRALSAVSIGERSCGPSPGGPQPVPDQGITARVRGGLNSISYQAAAAACAALAAVAVAPAASSAA